MKKLGLLSVLVLCILLSGCGEKKLLCSYTSTNSFYGSDSILAKYIFKKDNTIDRYVINEKMVFNDEYLKANNTTVDAQYDSALTYCKESVPNNKNIECEVTKYKNSVTVNINYNLSKMSAKDIESLNLSEYLTTKYDQIKEQYTSQGFTCK